VKHFLGTAFVALLLVSGFVSVTLAWVYSSDTTREVYISPDGKRIITTTLYARLTRIWDAETGKELARVNSDAPVAFSSDGTKFVNLKGNNEAEVFETETGKSLQNFKGHTGPLSSATFSSDGKKIVSTSEDGTARIWDIDTGKELLKMEGHIENPPNSDKDGRVNFSDRVNFAVFSPDGKAIVTFGNRRDDARVWDAESGKELRKLEGMPYMSAGLGVTVAFSPDSKTIIAGGSLAIRIWDVESGKELPKLVEGQGHTLVRSIAFSSDGKKIVTVGHGDPSITNKNYKPYFTARIWDADTGKELQKLEIFAPEQNVDEGPLPKPYTAALLPDGKQIITMYRMDTRIWDAESGQELEKIVLQDLYSPAM